MPKYTVSGKITLTVTKEIEINTENPDEIIRAATENFSGVYSLLHNGSFTKAVGVDGKGEAIYADGTPEFTSVKKVEG